MASSTMSLNVRSSSFGGGIMGLGAVLSGYAVRCFFVVLVLEIEREDEVAFVVLARNHVLDADVEAIRFVAIRRRRAAHFLDARLELVDRLFAVRRGHRGGERVVRREH